MTQFNSSRQFATTIDTLYHRSMAAIRSRDDEAKVIAAARAGSRDAVELIAGLCYPAIIKTASKPRYARFSGQLSELVAEAIAALPAAIADFDTSAGTRFITFFNPRIFNALNKAVFADNLVHIPENRLRNGEALAIARFVESDGEVDEEHPGISVDSVTAKESELSIAEEIDARTIRDAIARNARAALEPDERDIILAILADDSWSTDTHAMKTGMARERVAAIRKRALKKLAMRAELQEIAEEIA